MPEDDNNNKNQKRGERRRKKEDKERELVNRVEALRVYYDRVVAGDQYDESWLTEARELQVLLYRREEKVKIDSADAAVNSARLAKLLCRAVIDREVVDRCVTAMKADASKGEEEHGDDDGEY